MTALWSISFSFFYLSGIWLLTPTVVWMDKNLTISVLRKIIVYNNHSLSFARVIASGMPEIHPCTINGDVDVCG